MSTFEMEKYNAVKEVLLKEHRLDLESNEDYQEKFDQWKKAYPKTIKDQIIKSNGGNWSVIYREFHQVFREEVWGPYMSKLEMEKYNAVKEVLLKEYRLDLESNEDYEEKFHQWKKAYPKTIKDQIIESNGGDWSVIYREFNRLFKEEVT